MANPRTTKSSFGKYLNDINNAVRKRLLWGFVLFVSGFLVVALCAVFAKLLNQIIPSSVFEIFSFVSVSASSLAGLILIIIGFKDLPKLSKGLKQACIIFFIGIFLLPIGLWGTVALFRGEYSGVVFIGFIPIPLIVVWPLTIPTSLLLIISGALSFFTTRK